MQQPLYSSCITVIDFITLNQCLFFLCFVKKVSSFSSVLVLLLRMPYQESSHGILVKKFLDMLLQVPESISALSVSTTDAANHPVVVLSRSVTVSIIHGIADKIFRFF